MAEQMKKGTQIRTAFDEYTLVGQVGEGGNGRVYAAINNAGDSVAIKFVKRTIPIDKLKRFKNEIYFCERHKHKNIVEVLDHGYVEFSDDEYLFYVMPLYVATLRKKMQTTLAHNDAFEIFLGLIEGLAYAHNHGAIHRDIKPENIMFRSGSLVPIICDFGIAHFAEEEMIAIIETKKSDRLANFQYAAPEQRAKGEKAIAQTDVYAAALILNEMYTGEVPQAGDYKKIASVAPEYAFLDDVFAQLFKQNGADRLYPCEKILTEVKVRAEQHKRDQEKAKLQMIVNEAIKPEEFAASVIHKEYVDCRLVFTLSREIPEEWYRIMSNGRFGGHTEVVGYGPDKIEKDGRNAISMDLRGNESNDTIVRTVENVLNWVEKTNAAYNAFIIRAREAEQREKEKARKAEIEKLERESSISELLSRL